MIQRDIFTPAGIKITVYALTLEELLYIIKNTKTELMVRDGFDDEHVVAPPGYCIGTDDCEKFYIRKILPYDDIQTGLVFDTRDNNK